MPYIVDSRYSPYVPLVSVLEFEALEFAPIDAGLPGEELSPLARLTIDRVPGLRELLGVIETQELEETIAHLYRSFTAKVAHSAVLDLLTTTLRELLARGARPVYEPDLPPSLPTAFVPDVTAHEPAIFDEETFPPLLEPLTPRTPPQMTIDSLQGLRELLEMQIGGQQQIQEIEEQIAGYYRRFPHAQAQAAVHDLLTTTMLNLQGPPALMPRGPEYRPGLLDPTLPGQMIIPPDGNGEPIDGSGLPIAPDVPVDDEGSLLPLGIGAVLFLVNVL